MQVANMIFIDSPVGVGLSYSTDPADQEPYQADDYSTAADLNAAIHEWFRLHPFFQGHDFYITGESYAGRPHCPVGLAIVHLHDVSRLHEYVRRDRPSC